MAIEILLTGLCILDVRVANEIQFFCPRVEGHRARMYVEASSTANWHKPRKFDWVIGLDGQEKFAFDLDEIEAIVFIDENDKEMPAGNVTLDVAGLMEPDDLKMAYNKSHKVEGSSLPPIKLGSIVKKDVITKPMSCERQEYCREPEDRKYFYENVVWTVDKAVKIRISLSGGVKLTVPVKESGLRAVVSNDAISVEGGSFDLGFKHWDICVHHGKEIPCCPNADLFTGDYQEPKQCDGQLTSKPICNLLVVK